MTKHETFAKSNLFPKANGSLTFKGDWRWAWMGFTVHGGPFPNYVKGEDTFGLNLRAEKSHPCDAYLPITDFSVPTQTKEQVSATIALVLRNALSGKHVYVGCMGGWGRTGIALSIIAKVMGEADPVAYVRKHYSHRAVETEEQQAYVRDFDVTAIRAELQRFAWKRFIRSFWPF
ncbi:PTPc tyrosine phosphatase [Rhodobacter phage RcZahn]|nr:PTPc tyrosine phosphatase [Rhodobacter phage RcZahn]